MKNKHLWRASAVVVIWVLVLTGCRTTVGSSGFASVEIQQHSTEEILQTTAAVFRDDGYTLRSADGGRLVFERHGSTVNRVVYGSWGNDVVLRVSTQIVPLTPASSRLQCQASMVRHAGDRVLEDEQLLANFRSAPFQSLLNETARRLK